MDCGAVDGVQSWQGLHESWWVHSAAIFGAARPLSGWTVAAQSGISVDVLDSSNDIVLYNFFESDEFRFDEVAPGVIRRWRVTAGPTPDTVVVTVRVLNARARHLGTRLDLATVVRHGG